MFITIILSLVFGFLIYYGIAHLLIPFINDKPKEVISTSPVIFDLNKMQQENMIYTSRITLFEMFMSKHEEYVPLFKTANELNTSLKWKYTQLPEIFQCFQEHDKSIDYIVFYKDLESARLLGETTRYCRDKPVYYTIKYGCLCVVMK